MFAKGILLIYHNPAANASTIMEHVESFERYSRFNVWKVNTAYGFPRGLSKLEFSAIVLHYSHFGSFPFSLPERFRQYIEDCKRSVKIAFFQDEYQYCQQRFDVINRLGIDIIFTILEPKYFDKVYYSNTTVKKVLPTLTGYVCDSLVEKANLFTKPFISRNIDVGYRARPLPFYMGQGAQEKTDIATGFVDRCANSNLTLDIKTNNSDRIYGDKWNRFVGNCKFMLGVESGCSIFDLNGEVREKVEQYLRDYPLADFDEVEDAVLAPFENNIYYRAISPRLFECAASRTCMVLFRGTYQSILVPDKHYIVLEKDFSNMDEVLSKMSDHGFVSYLVENAYNDLIGSSVYHYSHFIKSFDETIEAGIQTHQLDEVYEVKVNRLLDRDTWIRHLMVQLKHLRHIRFPGRNVIKNALYKIDYRKNR